MGEKKESDIVPGPDNPISSIERNAIDHKLKYLMAKLKEKDLDQGVHRKVQYELWNPNDVANPRNLEYTEEPSYDTQFKGTNKERSLDDPVPEEGDEWLRLRNLANGLGTDIEQDSLSEESSNEDNFDEGDVDDFEGLNSEKLQKLEETDDEKDNENVQDLKQKDFNDDESETSDKFIYHNFLYEQKG